MSECTELVGKTISSVDLAEDKKAIRFNLADGSALIYLCDGDCCSRTWIENIDDVSKLIGTVSEVEDLRLDSVGDHGDSVTAYYGVKIKTDKGWAVIDYRNESNGYYGGNLVLKDDPKGYFYGGVFGQNISEENWKPAT